MLSENDLVNFRNSLNMFFDGKCDIYEETDVRINYADKKEKVLVFKDIPCHLSFKNNYFKRKADFIAKRQSGTLFLPWDSEIKTSSFFKVRQNNQEYSLYIRGNIRHYVSHIETDFVLEKPDFNSKKEME